MIEQPTKEFVLHLRHIASLNGDWDKDIITVCDAYLALREEMKEEEDRLRSGFQRTIDDLSRTIDLLQADNQALRESNDYFYEKLLDEQ